MHSANHTIPTSWRDDGLRRPKLSTEELAVGLRVKPQTIRAALCRHGHYLGLRPCKLPNGRLLWDAAEVDRLIAGDVVGVESV
ncbi:hypothetical protein LLG90_19975 [Aromatoleum toluclasticum]|uniref:hypothetical protein n=1 Tax=Aromatoleum toluclasticum TaxID=92003 RepID=UPI001D191681|nr:hypothetical protein [Aromatoleum toluclasticum]MCC4117642.1 hypothetical protein [Aromatoleum toluclasticum]